MIIIDSELKRRAAAGNPVKVGLVGAGFMARGIANTIINSVPGMRLVAIANRTVEKARGVFIEAGVEDVGVVDSAGDMEQAVRRGRPAITGDYSVLCGASGIDALLDCTGEVEFAAQVAMKAIENGKHMVINAELDATLGPILKCHAERAGVVLSGCDGDQPAVQMNLYRFVRSIGANPLVCGNIKGMLDRYRTPATQAAFAAENGITAKMATSFADGTKVSQEQAVIANATGMKVARRGMLGLEHRGHIDEMTGMYDVDMLRQCGGIVEFALGAVPSPGVYVFAEHGDARQSRMLNYCKLGDGPLYSFYVPYHLMTFEAHLSLARAVLFGDAAVAPLGGPVVDVVATAKRDLGPDEVLDGMGGHMVYGLTTRPLRSSCCRSAWRRDAG